MPEQFDSPVGFSSISTSWNFNIDASGTLELRSNSPDGGGEIRAAFASDSGQVDFGSTANPASVRVTSELKIHDSSDDLRIELSGDSQAISILNDNGEVVGRLGELGNLRLGSNQAGGQVQVFPASATDMSDETQASIVLHGNSGNLSLGGSGVDGDLYVRDDEGTTTVHINGSTAWLRAGTTGYDGNIEVLDSSGRQAIHLEAQHAVLRVGTEGNEGDIVVNDGNGVDVFRFDAANAWLRIGSEGNEGDIEVRDGANRRVMHMNGQNAVLRIGAQGNEGDLIVHDGADREVLHFNAESAWLRVGANGNEGDIEVQDAGGRRVMHMDGQYAVLRVGAAGNEGDIIVRDDNGNDSIHLNGGTGDIILRNADAAEDFTLASGVEAPAGSVMVLTDEASITPCREAYDGRVVGVVAGAGNYRPGIIMDRKETSDEARLPISIMGKVSCRVDAGYGAVRVGDLLTTSPTPGMAMKAADPVKAFGCVIGKALSALEAGTGMIDMLITMR